MLNVLKEVASKVYTSKTELVAAVNASLSTWATKMGITVVPFIATDFPDTVTVGTVAQLMGRKIMGFPTISYTKRDLSVVNLSSFTSLITAFESDFNSDPATGYLYYGMFDTLKKVAERADNFLNASVPAWLGSVDLALALKDKSCEVYTRPSSDPRLEHITWLNGVFDWKLLYRISGGTLQAYQNMPSIAQELQKTVELVSSTILDTDIKALDLYDFVMRSIYKAARAKYSYGLTKSAYTSGNGDFVSSGGCESILNRFLSLRHSESLYPVMFM